jgi:phage terminase Nu1 subunit (DNA packaging protein)
VQRKHNPLLTQNKSDDELLVEETDIHTSGVLASTVQRKHNPLLTQNKSDDELVVEETDIHTSGVLASTTQRKFNPLIGQDIPLMEQDILLEESYIQNAGDLLPHSTQRKFNPLIGQDIPLMEQDILLEESYIQNAGDLLPHSTQRKFNPLIGQDIPLMEQDILLEESYIQNAGDLLLHSTQRKFNPFIIISDESLLKEQTSILFTNVRDEQHLLEWIAHHQNIGFTHIHIFDHLSKIPVKSMVQHIPNVTVERKDIQLTEGVKLKDYFMRIAIQDISIPNQFDWMLYLDADEFLVLPKHANVHNFINSYENADQIGINWLLFGSNNKNTLTHGTLMENFTRCDVMLNHHVKSFVRPSQVIKPVNPHAYQINNPRQSIDIKKRIVNKKVPYFVYWGKTSIPDVTLADAYIAHYIYQDYHTYIERKCILPRDDTGEMREVLTEEQVHTKHNTIENRVPFELYNEKNKERMEYWEKCKDNQPIKTNST